MKDQQNCICSVCEFPFKPICVFVWASQLRPLWALLRKTQTFVCTNLLICLSAGIKTEINCFVLPVCVQMAVTLLNDESRDLPESSRDYFLMNHVIACHFREATANQKEWENDRNW